MFFSILLVLSASSSNEAKLEELKQKVIELKESIKTLQTLLIQSQKKLFRNEKPDRLPPMRRINKYLPEIEEVYLEPPNRLSYDKSKYQRGFNNVGERRRIPLIQYPTVYRVQKMNNQREGDVDDYAGRPRPQGRNLTSV